MHTFTIAPDTALIIVDVQHDFLPGGALGVTDGDQIITPLVDLAARVGLTVASADWHPADHCSFADPQAGRDGWPVHCVADTHGAQLHPRIEAVADLVVHKATMRDADAYSAFDATGLADTLRARGITDLIIGGLATDYCVRATVLDALAAGFAVQIADPIMRGVELAEGDVAQAVRDMLDAGAQMVEVVVTGARG